MRTLTKATMSAVSGLVLVMSYHSAAQGEQLTTTASSTGATTDGTGSTSDGTTSDGSTSDGSSSGSDDTTQSQSDDGASGSSDDSTSDDTTSGSSSSSGSSSGSSSSSSGSSSSGTFTGDAVQTRWGIVQVEITVENGKITTSEAVQYPTENPRDQEINAYAVPVLNQEAVAAQSASIDAVSGATVTSGGYVQSLQSAIDQAHL